ncbi:choice-of-anchor L domain-containing protein [Formosa sp. Hel3_A1_48]|uniref:choice-of-anchor L domain-containing protein n=1 Tax=Formosa sp. Hel3_A1_48 TaxID=1336795 RepID=UPI000AFF9145|nr:choice-of-anchor L domain-containing protein [Formosa sp. Hel3_A1_48]
MKVFTPIFLLTLVCSFSVLAQEINMQDGAINQCTGTLYDSGGVSANYANSEDITLTICAENPGDAVQLDFTFFDTQNGADILTIYNGDDNTASILGNYSGTNTPGQVIATNTSGCLTLTFQSNGSIGAGGFAATISCATPCQDIEAIIAATDPPTGLGGNLVINQGDSVNFTGDATFSLDGTGATYDWDFGDGSVDSGQNVSHNFFTIGTFTVTLNVTDTNPTGCSDSTTIVVQVLGPYLLVDQSTYTVEELVQDILVNSACAEISNIEFSTGTNFESTNGIGYFSGNGVSFPFTEGILLTTGDASEAEGPEATTLSSGSSNWPGDTDLENVIPDLSPGTSNNATYIKFDFVPLANSISFNFVFASEEYGTYQCEYTDAFAFLLTNNDTGQTTNLALVPETTDPISVLSVRNGAYNQDCQSSNEEFFAAYYGGGGLPATDSPIDFIGHSVSMTAQSQVTPNTSYTIKLVIADAIDTSWDAAVFLEAGSFDLGGDLGDDITIESGTALCLGDSLTLDTQFPDAQHTWYLNEVEIEGENLSTLEVSLAGSYSVDISFGADCVASDSVLVEYKLSPSIEAISDLTACNSANPTFDLSDNNTLILGTQDPLDYNITYHNTPEDAQNDLAPILTFTNYTPISNLELIYVRIEDALTGSCFITSSFNLILIDSPPISDVGDLVLCDDVTNDGIEEFNLEAQNTDILGTLNSDNYNVTYYTTYEDATLSENSLPNIYSSVSDQAIYVRIDTVDDENCFSVSPDPLFYLIVTNKATAAAPQDFFECDSSGTGALEATFDLEQQTATILGALQDPSTFTVTYHSDPTDAESGDSPLVSPLTITSTTIYVRVEEDGLPDCYETTQFDITVYPNPEVTDQSATVCSASTVGLTLADDVDGPSVVSYDLTSITPEAGLAADASNAVLGTNLASDAIASDVWTNTTATPLDVVYSFTPVSSDNCTGAAFTVTVTVNPLPVPAPAFIDSKCDDDTDGLQTFDMSGVAAQVIGAQTDMVVSYHLTLTDAENNTAALGDNITTTTPNLQTIHIRLENTLTNCYATSTIDLVVDPLPEIDLEGNYVICSDATGGGLDYVVVDPGLSPATYNFIWRDELGDVLSTDSTYTVDQGGIYSLEVSFASTAAGCSAPLEIFTVSESGAPAVAVDVVTEAFADTHVVVATAVGTGIYEFSLDQGPWLDSGTFIGVDPGDHTVYVRDVNGCGVTATMIYIVDYPKYFTPNGDGYHDTWNISSLRYQANAKIYIFDRYGKLLKQITPAGEGWDGTYNGQQMPTSDYWFSLEYHTEGQNDLKQFKAHFTLKR